MSIIKLQYSNHWLSTPFKANNTFTTVAIINWNIICLNLVLILRDYDTLSNTVYHDQD